MSASRLKTIRDECKSVVKGVVKKASSISSVRSDTSTPGSFEPNFVGFSPMTSQDSALSGDSNGASPQLSAGKTKKKRKSEPKGIKMLPKMRSVDTSHLEAMTSSDEEDGAAFQTKLRSPPAITRQLHTTDDRIADSTLSSGDASDLDTEVTDKDRKSKKKKKHKEKKKKHEKKSPKPGELNRSDALTPKSETKKKEKKSKKNKDPVQRIIMSPQVHSSSAHSMSSSSDEEENTSSRKIERLHNASGTSIGFIDRGPGLSAPVLSPKKTSKRKSQSGTDSEVGFIMGIGDSAKSDTSVSSSARTPKAKHRTVRDLTDGNTGQGMQSTETPMVQKQLKEISSDKLNLLEKRMKKKKKHRKDSGDGNAASASDAASPPKKVKLHSSPVRPTTSSESPKKAAKVSSPKKDKKSSPKRPIVELIKSPMESSQEMFVSPTKKRLSLSRKRKSGAGGAAAGEKETLPDLVLNKKPNMSSPIKSTNEDEGMGTQELFQSQSKHAPTPEIQRMRAKQLANMRMNIGDIDMSVDGSDVDSIQDEATVGTQRSEAEGYINGINMRSNKVWLEDCVGPKKELWLVRIPEEFDTKLLEDKEILMSGTMVIHKESDEKHKDIVYEWETQTMPDEKLQKSNMLAVLPSKKDKHFHAAGSFKGQLSVTRSMRIKPYLAPEDKRVKPNIPDGLKYRHHPFGTGSTPDDMVDGRKKKKKKKKNRHGDEESMDVSGSTSLNASMATSVNSSIATPNDSMSLGNTAEKKKKKKKDKSKDKENLNGSHADVSMPTDSGVRAWSFSQSAEKKKKKKKHKEMEKQVEDEMDTSEPELDIVIPEKKLKKKKHKKDKD